MSPQDESLLGYSKEEWIEDPGLWVKILHPEDRERVLVDHDHARETGEPFEAEYRLIASDGSVVWVRDEAVPLANGEKGPRRRAGVLMDVSDQKCYEEALRKSEERHRLLAKATGEAIWDNDLLSGTQEWDGATEALFGYPSHAGRTGAWWEDRVHPDDRERVLSGLGTILAEEGNVWAEEYRFRRADGSYAEVKDQGYVVRDGEGCPVRMVGSMKDVTERKRQEEGLREGEERFRTAFEGAAVGMAHVAPNGRWLRVNRKACEIVGYGREELLSLSFWDLTPTADRETSEGRIRQMLAGELGSYNMERRFVHKGGHLVWVSLSVSLVRGVSVGQAYFVCVAEDITARKLWDLRCGLLSLREREVMALMLRDLSNAEVAEELNVELPTVKTHVRSILKSLELKDRRALLRYYPS